MVEKKIMHSVCAVERHVTVNCIKMPSVPQQCFYDKFVVDNNKTYVGLNVNSPKALFLSFVLP